MLKSNILPKYANTYFEPSLDLRIQAFNLLAFAGIAAGIVASIVSFVTGIRINIVINLFISVLAFILVHLARKKNCYSFCYWFTVIVVFIIAFPYMFFMAGGYHSGMPCYFIFAIVYTALMLVGRDRILAIIIEFFIYSLVFLIAYFHPDTVTYFDTEMDLLIDTITACIMSTILLLFVIILYIRIYNNRQKQLEGLNRLKTEFLQDISHEMQNPLTTITTGIDFVSNSINKIENYLEANRALKIVQDEAMRLGRMVVGMVKLVAMSSNNESREKVDFTAMLNNCAEMYRLIIEKKSSTLRVNIPPNLPYAYGVADRLTQVLSNLLSNAAKYMQHNGQATLEASYDSVFITVIVTNTGDNIPHSILPNVFERGISGAESSGFGLPICKTIIEAHGGTIKIESEPDRGTAVTFTIPVYGGQNEVR